VSTRVRTRNESLAFRVTDIRAWLHVIIGVAKGVAKEIRLPDPLQTLQMVNYLLR